MFYLTPSYSEHLRGTNTEEGTNTLSEASHHHDLSHQECEIIVGKGVRLCKGPKRVTCGSMSRELACIWHIQLLKTHHAAHLWSTDKQKMIMHVAGNIFLSACFCEWAVACSALVKHFSETEGIKGAAGKA